MNRYLRYPAYKPSGVEWLGEIPAHWDYAPVWLLFKLGRGRVISNEEIMDNPGPYPVFSSQTENEGVMGYLASYDFEGDYLTWTTDGANAGTVFYRSGQFNCTNVCGTLSPTSELIGDLRFFRYALDLSTDWFVRHDINPKLMNNVMGRIRVQIPPIEEQEAIVAFLDEQTAVLDNLITEKRTLIDLLQEKRTAVISTAVTQGLDTAVAMKESGVDWIGRIPAHWESTTFRRICHLQQGLQIAQSERFSEPGPDRLEYITIRSIHAGDSLEIREFIEDPPDRVICFPDDILMARTGATGEVITNQYGAFHNNFFKVNYDRNKVARDFLVYYLSKIQIKEHLLLMAGTTTIPDLNHGAFLDTPITFPPLEEQELIVRYLDAETAVLDELIAETEASIATLQEYRTALIAAAVTGQIDVRSML